MWKPKDPKAVALIKLTLWAGLVVWMLCTVAMAVALAKQFGTLAPGLLGGGSWSYFLGHWLVPIWVVFKLLC